MTPPTDDQYKAAAKRLHQVEGEVEIDNWPETAVSHSETNEGETGAYVQAWVWVPIDEAEREGS